MSASVDASSIKVRDSPKQILKKINQYAFSGGKETVEEHREKGGDPEIDVSYQYLKFFLEVSAILSSFTIHANEVKDDEELEKIRQDYKSGKMLTGELKKKCADELAQFVTAFQERRAKVTDEVLDRFMTPRPLLCRGTTLSVMVGGEQSELVSTVPGKDPNSKNQAKKMAKLQAAEAKKAQKALETEERLRKEASAARVVPEHTFVEDGTQKLDDPLK